MRWQRQLVSDVQPGSAHLAAMATRVREQRHALPDDHPARQVEKQFSDLVEISMNLYRDLRDQATVNWTRLAFGPYGLGAWLKPLPSDAERAEQRASADLARHRREVLPHLGTGNLARAVCRIVQAGMLETGSFERRSLRLARQLADRYPNDAQDEAIDWRALMREEARVLAVAPTQALQAVAAMLPDTDLRERALAVAAAVLMVDPTPEAPQYDVVERLMVYLGVSPDRVFERAQALVQPFEQGNDAPTRSGAAEQPIAATAATPATPKRARRGARAATPIVRASRKGLSAADA